MNEEINTVEKKSIGWGVASLVTSIFSLMLFIAPYLGLPLAIFAIIANYKQKKIQETGMGTAGFIMGIIGVVINGIMTVFVIIGLLVMIGMTGEL